MKYADLHLHTLFSDGTYTPEELVRASKRASLSAIAITDHDNVEAIPQALLVAADEGIEIISGIELSAEYFGIEVHILGYLFDYAHQGLLEKLRFLRQNRVVRIHKIVEKLNAIGVDLAADDVFTLAGNATVGRLHVARALVKRGFVPSVFEAFQRYIGDRSEAYVLGFKFSPEEAIRLIKDAGGIAVLAHPYSLRNDEFIAQFIQYGLGGIEVYYPEHSQAMIKAYLALAQKYNLLLTGGSDFHGNAKPNVSLGQTMIPYYLVEDLKEAKQKLR